MHRNLKHGQDIKQDEQSEEMNACRVSYSSRHLLILISIESYIPDIWCRQKYCLQENCGNGQKSVQATMLPARNQYVSTYES
eukprot:scaffold6115_cov110-Skeletonema_dohrnii-CCMP3373.AAC.3